MRRVLQAGLISLLVVGAGTAAAQEIKPGVCFRAEMPRSYGPVRSITAKLDKNGVDIQFTEWDAPNIIFLAGAHCADTSGRLIRCSIECDGGHADLALTPDGRLSLLARNLRTSSLGQELRLLGSQDADGGILSGSYVLSESPEAQCTPEGETYHVTLQAGDDTPSVAAAEQLLNDLGFLLEKPDTIYSDRTRTAVAQFQAASGLRATGVLDAETARRLMAQAAENGGC